MIKFGYKLAHTNYPYFIISKVLLKLGFLHEILLIKKKFLINYTCHSGFGN